MGLIEETRRRTPDTNAVIVAAPAPVEKFITPPPIRRRRHFAIECHLIEQELRGLRVPEAAIEHHLHQMERLHALRLRQEQERDRQARKALHHRAGHSGPQRRRRASASP